MDLGSGTAKFFEVDKGEDRIARNRYLELTQESRVGES